MVNRNLLRQFDLSEEDLEAQLAMDWRETYSDREWDEYRDSIRRGWDYEERLRNAA